MGMVMKRYEQYDMGNMLMGMSVAFLLVQISNLFSAYITMPTYLSLLTSVLVIVYLLNMGRLSRYIRGCATALTCYIGAYLVRLCAVFLFRDNADFVMLISVGSQILSAVSCVIACRSINSVNGLEENITFRHFGLVVQILYGVLTVVMLCLFVMANGQSDDTAMRYMRAALQVQIGANILYICHAGGAAILFLGKSKVQTENR